MTDPNDQRPFKEWLAEQIVILQRGGSRAQRRTHAELADQLLPVLRRMAYVQLRRTGLAAHWEFADDAVSHSYAAFLNSIATFREPYDVLAWFRVVMRNYFYQEGGRRKNIVHTDDQFVLDGQSYDESLVLSPGSYLREALRSLPPEQQDVLCQRFWEGKTQSEIAALKRVSRQRITQLEGRAVAALRKALTKAGYTNEGWADIRTG